jgi:hypothetical protein
MVLPNFSVRSAATRAATAVAAKRRGWVHNTLHAAPRPIHTDRPSNWIEYIIEKR